MNTGAWQLLVWLVIGGALYWAWHVRRWREIGCSKCDGKGTFTSQSLVLGHPLKRPCPRCNAKPWRRRKGSPDPDKR